LGPADNPNAGVTLRDGAGHFIAVLAETPTEYVFGDPLTGRIAVPKNLVNKQFRFTGFFMAVHRRDAAGG
jgi:hypothetical protein